MIKSLNCGWPQCARMDLNKKFVNKPKTTTA